ncbi:DNA-processing protein DprA [Merdimmobilis hominis]|jgi:DNA processing protein|uniref:Uncharacterized protein n=1 Tax=uncultured Anaerotruncus sp. TaxID=905011 RepID=A0A6N2RLY7_9FIRM|nr:DNA-processing protein DprA [Merdimmobilis hominis]MCD4836535.1 DNA-processing protein DprA [Merdimmobilis hominis]
MEEALYWMWFQQVFGVGTRRAEEVLSRVGHPRKLYEMDRINLARLGIFSQKELSLLGNTTLDQARKNAAEARRLGFEILTPEDLKYPNLLKNIYSCPLVLYVEGELPDLSQQLPIAMVGTRNFTEYGKRVGKTLSGDLARAGAVVVSGLAVGIDAICHAGAIAGGGKTVAVLGCGLDVDYPRQNSDLHRLISQNGAVISEYPPGTPPNPGHFPCRNRIISGLSKGVVVVEAGERSGSLITAGLALSQDRDVFAVPGRIEEPNSKGTHKLIQQGAKLTACAQDVLEEYLYSGYAFHLPQQPAPERKSKERPPTINQKTQPAARPPEYLNPPQLSIYKLLEQGPRSAEQIAQEGRMPVAKVLSTLTELEIYGAVTALPGGRYSL